MSHKKRARNQRYHSTKIDVDQVMDKKVYIIVDGRGQPVTHDEGHLLIFHRRRDANKWLQLEALSSDPPLFWKVKRLKIYLEE